MEDFPQTPERLPLDSHGCPCRRHQSDLPSSGSLFRTPHPKQELCECSTIREQFLASGHEIEGRIHLDHGAPRARSSRFCEFIVTKKVEVARVWFRNPCSKRLHVDYRSRRTGNGCGKVQVSEW